ncbi:MAG TPA: hypothetical protein VLS48_08820 [Anaerolineales bacterium]|nr:hypothetical protein [Anaerolineales bacterium]
MMDRVTGQPRVFPRHGWAGLVLILVFWALNWSLPGPRTHWGFFPLWLGYCLTIDALVFLRKGTSLLTRSRSKYISLFFISALVWWIFEFFNWRLRNWYYDGAELFSPLVFFLLATLSFTTVIPAVFGSAELIGSFTFFRRLGKGPRIGVDRRTTVLFFAAGWLMLALMWAWPRLFFPFLWIAVYFILEPLNVWLNNHSLADHTARGDWRPVLALWLGVLVTAFFWEMWNYFSYPKWIYTVPWGDWLHVFEMPLLGYGGYLPFALELHAMYFLVMGFFGQGRTGYLQFIAKDQGDGGE